MRSIGTAALCGEATLPKNDPARRLVRAAVWVLIGAAAGAPAFAQTAPTSTAEGPSTAATAEPSNTPLEEVVVTGSRVATNGANAPTPVTTVTGQQLLLAAPSAIVDGLNQLPQMMNSNTPQSTGVGTTGSVGQSFLNLRSLGANRTLTLLDGARVVPSSLLAETDVSLIPESLIQRVDIVTGGASAVYGSDAVAGVVNFILDKKFNGLSIKVQGGESDDQDDRNGKAELTAGTDLFGGRGHVEFAGEIYKSDGVRNYASRDWFDSCALISNPAGAPTYIPACNVHSAQFTYGGNISTGPLKGTYFGPGGTPQQFHYGTDVSTASMIGGTGEGGANGDVGAYFTPVPEIERKNAFGRFDYEISDHLSAYGQVLVAESQAQFNSGTWPWQGTTSGYQIQVDNAYLPASIRTAMLADGISSFVMNRQDEDFGGLLTTSTNRTQEYKAGLSGNWGSWKLDAYVEHGENRFRETTNNNPIVDNEYNAADAVVNPVSGQIVCRSSLTQPTNGCVPINLFGQGSPSQQALAYVTGTGENRIVNKEDIAEASLSDQPFNTWAGPVSIAFGTGFRRESADQTVDPISASTKTFTGGYLGFPTALQGVFGGFDRGNPQPVSGSYDLEELFAETLVPLAKDLPGAKSLDFNGAVRETHYTTSGSVTSWKMGLIWQPIDDIRVRAAHSRDIRAPNVNELYLGKSQGQSSLVDDFAPVGSPNRIPVVYTITSGNRDLKPEIADTTTVGLVLTPTWLPSFMFSLDRYDIRIKDAITTLTGQNTIDQCFAGATSLCTLLTRDAEGVLTAVTTPYLNIGAEDSSGLDIEGDYNLRLSDLFAPAKGNVVFRALATHVDHLTQEIPGAPNILLAGQTGAAGGVPHWEGTLSALYSIDPVSLFVQERLIGPGKFNNTYGPKTLAPQFNTVGGVAYTDVTLTYDFSAMHKDWNAFFTINNAFDRSPPPAYSPYFVFGTANGGTNPSLFDIVGRAFTLGIKLTL